jgi:hypothetical protein
MNEVGRRFVQTIRMERDAFVWMDFNDRATGDALILLLIGRFLLLIGLFGFGLRSLIDPDALIAILSFMFQGLVMWLIYCGAMYAILRYLLQRTTSFALLMRITGFAYPTVLVTLALVTFVNVGGRGTLFLVALIGGAWYIAIVARGLGYAVEIPFWNGIAVAAGAYVGYLVVARIFGYPPI